MQSKAKRSEAKQSRENNNSRTNCFRPAAAESRPGGQHFAAVLDFLCIPNIVAADFGLLPFARRPACLPPSVAGPLFMWSTTAAERHIEAHAGKGCRQPAQPPHISLAAIHILMCRGGGSDCGDSSLGSTGLASRQQQLKPKNV